LSQTTALVAPAGRVPGSLVESTGPLLANTDAAHPVPVNLALQDQGGSVAPMHAAVPVHFARQADGGFGFDRLGVQLQPLGLRSASTGKRVRDGDKLMYPNATVDTDLLSAAVPNGVETFAILRSPASPESLSWRFVLPTGATLQPVMDAANAVKEIDVIANGKTELAVPAPTAADAQGKSVPTTMALDGDVLTITAPHRAKDYAYPITVDPYVAETWNWSGGSTDWRTWAWAASRYDPPPIFNWQYYYNPNGLLQTATTYPRYESPREWEAWYTNAGHANTYIWQAYTVTNHQAAYDYDPYNPEGFYQGLLDPNYAALWQPGSPQGRTDSYSGWGAWECASPCSPQTAPPSWGASLNGPNNYFYAEQWYANYASGGASFISYATLYVSQRQPPRVDPIAVPGSGGWLRGVQSFGSHAFDGGLGLQNMTLSGPQGQVLASTAPQCDGTRNAPCPADLYGLSVDTHNLPDGTDTVFLNANNIVDLPAPQQQATINVDNTPPTASITPALAPFVGQTINISGTASDATSGVANWTAQVNGPGTNGQWQTVCSTTTSQNRSS